MKREPKIKTKTEKEFKKNQALKVVIAYIPI